MSAVVLINPKSVRNLATAVRAAACFGVEEIVFTGERIFRDAADHTRLPRELRMKAYEEVHWLWDDKPLLALEGTPVAVEFDNGYVPLPSFEHPENAIYVFGPEDGSLSRGILKCCHQFVMIPSRHCLNLAMAVNIVLYDREVKCQKQGG